MAIWKVGANERANLRVQAEMYWSVGGGVELSEPLGASYLVRATPTRAATNGCTNSPEKNS